MAGDDSDQVITGNGETLISSTITAEDDKDKDVLKLISDAVREAPANTIKDLWSIGVRSLQPLSVTFFFLKKKIQFEFLALIEHFEVWLYIEGFKVSSLFSVMVQVCARCIFRVLGIHELICSHASLSYSVLRTILGEVVRVEGGDGVDSSAKHELFNIQELTTEAKVCKICLGVLQFVFSDGNGALLKKDSAYDFASEIAELVKQQQHHQVGSFSLEVSLPPLVTENDQAIW